MGLGQMTRNEEVEAIQTLVARRKEVGVAIFNLWTEDGADLAGLAGPLFDGRLDALGQFTCAADFHDSSLGDTVPTISHQDASSLSYENFRDEYMLPNEPIVIKGLTSTWGARTWLEKDECGEEVPNMLRLCELFGSETVPVHRQSRAGFSVARPLKQDMTVEEYAAWWELHHSEEQEELLYLKDWKFVVSRPSVNAYEWPVFFQDDWLNGAMRNAYKFIYLGPAGTSTRLHVDVLRSFSWSTNVCGKKEWFLVPPEQTYLLMDCFGRNLAPDLHTDITHGLDFLYPGLKYARKHATRVIQQPGETIFVPTNWFHTVENLSPTLSINHNWLNAANIGACWEVIRQELEKTNGSAAGTSGTSTTDTDGDTSQLGDDLCLLWLVLSQKARHILLCGDSNSHASDFDLQTILSILEGIQGLVHNGNDEGLTKRCECYIDGLIDDIRSALGR